MSEKAIETFSTFGVGGKRILVRARAIRMIVIAPAAENVVAQGIEPIRYHGDKRRISSS